ncbi:hypothetical protein [Algibacter mikhailovii]|uniref:hypothetical protein n=1 Tax=Algibacter mikhailovii TaxID=425498 RepID=UPI0016774829|nr:hypothetical protein [Algibacter mikhailovii]
MLISKVNQTKALAFIGFTHNLAYFTIKDAKWYTQSLGVPQNLYIFHGIKTH